MDKVKFLERLKEVYEAKLEEEGNTSETVHFLLDGIHCLREENLELEEEIESLRTRSDYLNRVVDCLLILIEKMKKESDYED